jgi:5'-nucleotidase (lipoprotein e(P4) family)
VHEKPSPPKISIMKKCTALLIIILTVRLVNAQEVMHVIDESLLKEYPVLWQQQSAEYRALCYQAFNIALLRLNAIPKKQFRKQKLAIITDLDETIIDNSYQEARLIKEGKSFTSKSWKEWTAKSAATAVPGAVEFLQAAKQKGVSIFYISNRDTGDIASTLLNLQKLQLPDADRAHLLFLSDTPGKEPRRQMVRNTHRVIMLLGDNLNDFMSVFEKKPSNERKAETDKLREDWGKTFIVLPNATYGEWESAIYDYKRNLSPAEKEAIRKQTLIGF